MKRDSSLDNVTSLWLFELNALAIGTGGRTKKIMLAKGVQKLSSFCIQKRARNSDYYSDYVKRQ